MTIGFIGLGNMAKAMIGGILEKGLMAPNEIIGTAATEETRKKVAEKFGIQVRTSNEAVAKEADIIILAVKPQYLKVVIADIMDSVDDKKLVVTELTKLKEKTTDELIQNIFVMCVKKLK